MDIDVLRQIFEHYIEIERPSTNDEIMIIFDRSVEEAERG